MADGNGTRRLESTSPLDAPALAEQHSRGAEESNGHSPFPIVGIGASAGGMQAFRQLLTALPAETGMAFLLVQHLDPTHESGLAGLLGRFTQMPVVEASAGARVEPNHVYVIPPNTNLGIAQGVLHLTPRDPSSVHLPVDYLFRSLAEDRQARAIGVVLSGTGSDGTLGLCEIKGVGGITFAQDEHSAGHYGMPRSAVDSGCVDFVLTAPEIAERVARIGDHPYLAPNPHAPAAPPDDTPADFHRVLQLVRSVTGVDFSLYRDTTIRRRILRRMALHGNHTLAQYRERLEASRPEVEALYHDLLITVTSFFRDPELFDTLKTKVFPDIARTKPPNDPWRVWVPGCSTGQEAYSIAMALTEFFDEQPSRAAIQIFATDLSDQTALDKGRAGLYPETIEAEVSATRLRRFFKREGHVYRIDKSMRDACVFARHNVAADPPFSHLDLVTCRNVLIYLSTPLQKRVLPTFHYALNPSGYLVLGPAETASDFTDLFDLADRTHKIYAKKPGASPRMFHFTTERLRGTTSATRLELPVAPAVDFQKEADRVLLGRFAPPGVLVNDAFKIVQFRGRTSDFLEPPPGEPTTSLLKMAREGLFMELRSALMEAQARGEPVRRSPVHVLRPGGGEDVSLEVLPVRPPGSNADCFLVLFHRGDTADASPAPAPMSNASSVAAFVGGERELQQLRQELAATKEYLQSLAEQQEAANEELRSANEEILSSNEELQSTNEELETAKEELQSANEELTTVNEQLRLRNLELTQATNDWTNLLSSTNIPVVMVDSDLRIRRFTAPARKTLRLLPSDVGRPITDINPGMQIQRLDALISEVVETTQTRATEVLDSEGRWHELRVFPYRTQDDKIDGAVIVLVDIDRPKRAEQQLREIDRRKDEFLSTLAHELRNPIAPIRNAVNLMRLVPDDPDAVVRTSELLDRQVRQLTRIIDELIDYSRIVEKKVEVHLERVPVSMIVDMAMETCRPLIDSQQQKLTLSPAPEAVLVEADSARLTQVLVNLLNNASHYTPRGGNVEVQVEVATRADAEPPTGEVAIRVRDDGIGISPELLPRVFDMFTQGEPRTDRARSGLGIGLSLVRSLVQMHGGSVEAHSAGAGLGSEFVVRLPAIAPSQPKPTPLTAAPMKSTPHAAQRVLVVDDNEDNLETLATLLRLAGHEVRVAHSGTEALAAVSEWIPHAALIDIGLPGMSGHDVARRLRALPGFERVMLVAQTGWGTDGDRALSAAAGFHHHLVKPVDPDAIRRLLVQLP